MANISVLLSALHSEVNRIADEQASVDKSDELSEVLLDSIHTTLSEIKAGADSDAFKELAVVNFIIEAARAGYPTESIKMFVEELKK